MSSKHSVMGGVVTHSHLFTVEGWPSSDLQISFCVAVKHSPPPPPWSHDKTWTNNYRVDAHNLDKKDIKTNVNVEPLSFNI